ncbi:MAG: isochorismatase family protein [Firmicutes bacterium]|nr:isochorismatase family protein [Bacillota bacterium]
MAIWDDILDERDRHVVATCGFGAIRGFGDKPALLIIDAQYNFVGEKAAIEQSLTETPTGIGQDAWKAVERIAELAGESRKLGIPVVYTVCKRTEEDRVYDSFRRKRFPEVTKTMMTKPRGAEIVDELAPQKGDIVVLKKYPSAFFGTPMMTILNSLHVDTLIITGFVTSGCVRATVVDAASYNFNVIIPEEAVSDRIAVSHKVNLLDMHLKYADVMPMADVMRAIRATGRS